jgi:hypothetical protein
MKEVIKRFVSWEVIVGMAFVVIGALLVLTDFHLIHLVVVFQM